MSNDYEDWDDLDDQEDDWDDDWEDPYEDDEEEAPDEFPNEEEVEGEEGAPTPSVLPKAAGALGIAALLAGGLFWLTLDRSEPVEPSPPSASSTSTTTTTSETTVDMDPVSDPSPTTTTPVGAVAGFIVAFYQDHDPEAVISYYDPDAGLKASVVGEEVESVEWATDVSYDVTPISETTFDVTVNLSGNGGRGATIEQTFTVTEVGDEYRVKSIS